MPCRSLPALAPVLLAAACASRPLVPAPEPRDAATADLQDLSVSEPPDLTVPPDLTAPPRDLVTPPDLARCVLGSQDPATCPCGAEGLCRPATGRLVVQTRSSGGRQRLVVMDDNGCRRFEVTQDLPLGTPKWAPDGERLAYVTGGNSSATLHVLRVAAAGQVTCHATFRTRTETTDVAWASDTELWLFSSTQKELVRWRLGTGIVSRQSLLATRFDAKDEGPLVYVTRTCDTCPYEVYWRPQAGTAGGEQSLDQATANIGPARLSRDGQRAVWERSGVHYTQLGGSDAPRVLGQAGDRSPGFALDDQALIHTTDDGQLRYYVIAGADAGQTLVIPPTWSNVFSPDWSPPPESCQPRADCF
ncbi:MAG TPA: hypothetical protein VH877_10575 [Polyangia bacterium]|jgi:hypothetical protein|nr:hypothetical protein [Polyangia bacterium]